MIKLIATDCDGTLMPESTGDIDPAYFDEIRRLSGMGIRFAAVSGREYCSLQMLMQPVKDITIFVADNGAVLRQNDKEIFTISLDQDLVRDALCYIRTLSPVDYCFLSTAEGVVTDSDNEELIRALEYGYNEKIIRVDDLMKIDSAITKVAVHTPGDSKDLSGEARSLFQDRANVVESGLHWLDFAPRQANKGRAIQYLQEWYGISKEETIAFGDNVNDIAMLQSAGVSYAVAEARDEVKKAATHTIGSYRDLSVLKVLQSLR